VAHLAVSPVSVSVERETGSSTNKKVRCHNILDDFTQKDKFYEKIPEANKIRWMFV
jgi:hypothetical protein